MTLYFVGRPVRVEGACDDGWVWAPDEGKSGEWYWMAQLHARPWGDA